MPESAQNGPADSTIDMRRVYLDNNATTSLAPEVFEAMKPFLGLDFGNASSIHWFGQKAKAGVEAAREQVARLIGARAREIVLTSGGTEADNLAIFGIAGAVRQEEKHIITSSIEHHAVMNSCKAIQQRGVQVTFLRVGSEGIVDPDEVTRAIRPETVLISVMHANNELGTIQPIPEIARIAAEHDIYFHSDAVQSAGKIPLSVEELGVDLLSLSAHKIHGPQGIGALYVRRGTPLRALLYGGHHERDRRAGTENVAGAVGFGKAAEMAANPAAGEIERVARLRDQLESGNSRKRPTGADQRRREAASHLDQQPGNQLRRRGRVRDRNGFEGCGLFDGRRLLLGFARTIPRHVGHPENRRPGAVQHSLQPQPLQYDRRHPVHTRNPARRRRTSPLPLPALQETGGRLIPSRAASRRARSRGTISFSRP